MPRTSGSSLTPLTLHRCSRMPRLFRARRARSAASFPGSTRRHRPAGSTCAAREVAANPPARRATAPAHCRPALEQGPGGPRRPAALPGHPAWRHRGLAPGLAHDRDGHDVGALAPVVDPARRAGRRPAPGRGIHDEGARRVRPTRSSPARRRRRRGWRQTPRARRCPSRSSRTVTALIGQPARRSSGHPDGAGRGPRPAWRLPRRESPGDDLDEHTSIDIEHGLVAIAEEVREEHGTTAHRRQRLHLLGRSAGRSTAGPTSRATEPAPRHTGPSRPPCGGHRWRPTVPLRASGWTASTSSEHTPWTGMPSAWPIVTAVTRPTRSPVKGPARCRPRSRRGRAAPDRCPATVPR